MEEELKGVVGLTTRLPQLGHLVLDRMVAQAARLEQNGALILVICRVGPEARVLLAVSGLAVEVAVVVGQAQLGAMVMFGQAAAGVMALTVGSEQVAAVGVWLA